MNRDQFDIVFVNIEAGKHRFSFTITPAFFKGFEESIIGDCKGKVELFIEKKNERLFDLEFIVKGVMRLECGRCLNSFDYSFHNAYRMELQLSDKKDSDDENLIIAGLEEKKINVADQIYEFFTLQIPIKATCELAKLECNKEMLKTISNYEINVSAYDSAVDPRWEVLKKLSKS
jgi:uncharacterized metal-binding protein YceD (DUF177 family)